MRLRNYILDGKKPVATTDNALWGRRFVDGSRIVRQEKLPNGIEVSTVFLAVDHRWDDGPPVLFETMIFVNGEPADGCRRYSTWDEAEAGHAEMVEVAKGIINFANTSHE